MGLSLRGSAGPRCSPERDIQKIQLPSGGTLFTLPKVTVAGLHGCEPRQVATGSGAATAQG